MLDKIKEFKPSSWAINNKTSIYIMTIIITLAGIMSYNGLPKEQFPEVVFPQIIISTVQAGTSPKDMENIVTKHIEKSVKSISGVKKVTSSSLQNVSLVTVEFNTDVQIPIAKQRVKDQVDKIRKELPQVLTSEPTVVEIDVSQMPIMFVHLSGDYPLDKLKEYAEDLQDKIESLKEITRADIVGALDREVQVNLDMYKMQIADVAMYDVMNAIGNENVTISGGSVKMDGLLREINVVGQYIDARKIGDLAIRSASGAIVYLRDIAEVKDGFKEQESFARLEHKNVITLNIVKKSGQNLIDASDKIRKINEEMKKAHFPEGLKITITGDQSNKTRTTLHDLINTIVIGFILVTIILMFFMGATNALFVAMSVPLSMAIAFLFLPAIGFTLNMIVLFAFLLALGIVVDDAIVVVENTHRIFENGKIPIKKAAKLAAGEVFIPVLSGTLTTLAPFIPLAFWQGTIGKFMFFLPVTLIITLLASLLVAYIINPVFAVGFMKTHEEEEAQRKNKKGFMITSIVFGVIALLVYLTGNFGLGNFIVVIYGLYCLNRFVMYKYIENFQNKTWPSVQEVYRKLITWCLKGKRPIFLLVGTIGLLFFSIFLVKVRSPKVVFFPQASPNFVYTYIEMPVGTDQVVTDSITKLVEERIYKEIGDSNKIVESVISNVAIGAGDPTQFEAGAKSNLGKVTVAFVEFGKRHGEKTLPYLDRIRKVVKDIPGVLITVEQEKGGPPTGKPVNIEIIGEEFDELTTVSKGLKHYLDSLQIPGVEELKSDLVTNKPEILIEVDRERANREGISSAQIGQALRGAIFGMEVSKFKDAKDDYPIQVRYKFDQRNNIDALMNLKITYRDMNMGGQLRSVPLSSVAKLKYSQTYGGIRRKNQKRIVSLGSNVLSGYNANEVVAQVKKAVAKYELPNTVTTDMTGEQEQQAETGAFLGKAMLIALGLIFLILVTQFNSISKPVIILSEIVLSIIGVLLGFSIFKMDMSILMTGVGVVALAGIVVRNGILLVEFTDLLLEEGMELKEAIIEAGKTRMTPVILTATATILGLIPLAIGLNVDFVTLF
ncbi:MAG: efflux RND transporter permease subunit, partial [Bacteroidetes bacterium]|nr:efflux RND transporter permease subunit [Bacteroidota bacterium]